jgi:demethylmenaquinone methyltransferase/2-methoxy-6-polyprenyl-1,4-benzoquinol methylase
VSLKKTALDIFGGLAPSYDAVLNAATLFQDRYWKQWLIQHAAIKPSERVLDIGCGTCVLEEMIDSLGPAVVGLDLTEEMLKEGKNKRIGSVVLLARGDAESTPFGDSSFDLVVSCYVPKYVNLPSFASEVARVLKPGGRAVIYDFVKPRGWISPVLVFYDRVVMGGAGVVLHAARNPAATTFRNIGWIVDEASWQEPLRDELEDNGVICEELVELTGGVVAAYCGVKV